MWFGRQSQGVQFGRGSQSGKEKSRHSKTRGKIMSHFILDLSCSQIQLFSFLEHP